MKKTTMKIGLIALALTLSSQTMQAQQFGVADAVTVDGWGRQTQDLSKLPKMEKDIIILQNVLGDLFSPNNSERFFSSRNAKGMYVPGNGVIFSLGTNNMYGDLMEYMVIQEGQADDKGEKEVDLDELNKQTEEKLRSKSREFLANYGSLLSELKSGEKLMLNIDYTVRQKRDENRAVSGRVSFVTSRSSIKKRMQSSISYKTLNDFTTGKINMDQAMNAIEVSIVDDAEKDMTDAKILAGILDDLMQSSLDGKFRRRSKTSWTYFEGFGLMFNIQMGTQVSNGLVIYSQGGAGTISRVDADDREKEREEKLKEIEEAYPEFENMLKENIIQYGRTLRSLGSGESVIVNVDFGSSFRDSKLPRSIRMIVPKSSIEAFAKGQKSLDQVKKEIDIKQLQSSIGGNGTYIYGGADDFFPAVYETFPEPSAPRAIQGAAVRGTGQSSGKKSNR